MRQVLQEAHAQIKAITGVELDPKDWAIVPDKKLGDISIPCFKLSKALGKAPPQVATEIVSKFKISGAIESVQAVGPYVNLKINIEKCLDIYSKILSDHPNQFASSQKGKGKTIVIDFSSPNVAKEIALHHLRSTAIGNALSKIAERSGYKVEKINYLGDWGTSFGKLIIALEMFGKESELEKGLPYMLDIYVRFNKAEKENPELSEKAKAAFQKVEAGDKDYQRLWKAFRDISIREFKKVYERIGITFDHYDGESFYQKDLDRVVKEIDKKIGTRISDGALVCDLPGHKIPVLLKKDDGASLYITRDVAAAEDRFKRFNYDESWYVVAVQQKLHFEQLFTLIKELKEPFAGRLKHISFGMLSFGSKTMKTREGNVFVLTDVLDEAHARALEIIKAKNPDLKNADETAEMIGIGAILFYDLSQNKTHDVKFEWEKALSFEGDTSPFIQYTYARCRSLLKKCDAHLKTLSDSGSASDISSLFLEPAIRNLLSDIMFFELYFDRAMNDLDPSQIASSLLNISKSMNQLYHKIRFMDESKKNRLSALMKLTSSTASALKEGLNLLGIKAPEEM